jgi:hypothetical protein
MAALIAASIAVALTVNAQDQHSALPVVITQMWIETRDGLPNGAGMVRVELLNTGQRTILAWGVRFVLKRPDGSTVSSSGLGLDSASVLPEDRNASIAPGRTAHNSGGGASAPADTLFSDAAVTFVIFDDDTALGDEREIASIFAQRRRRQIFWQKMQAILDGATSHETDPSGVLSRIRQGMEAESDPKFREGGWYNEILARMSARRMDVAGTTTQRVLASLRTTVAAQKANADAHATRR